ncbi:MAG: hypothetical protein DMF82_24130, partial [Acidobacteria bacterium]
MLTRQAGILFGATYVDIHARVPALRVLIAAAVVAAVVSVVEAVRGRVRYLLVAAALYLVVLLGGEVYASLLQRFVVAPNEQVKETPYILHNIESTRAAFALRAVAEHDLSGDDVLTSDDIDRNAATLKNVPLWDQRAALGPPAAARHLPAAPGDAHLLRLRVGRPRAELREPAEPELDQRAADLHARLRPDPGSGEPGDARGAARPLHQEHPARVGGGPQGHRAQHLFRRAVERPRLRADAHEGVPLPAGRGQRHHGVRGRRRRPPRRPFRQAALRGSLRRAEDAALGRPDPGQPRALSPPHRGARAPHRAVPDLRPRSLPGDRGQPAGVGAGRLHDERALPLRAADHGRGHQLHPQLGEGHDRRVPRAHDLLPRGSRRPGGRDLRPDLPGTLAAPLRDAGEPPHAVAVPAHDLRAAGRGVLDLPHAQPRGLLQQGGPVGGAGAGGGRAERAHGALLHGHEAAGRDAGGVHRDAPVHAAGEGQPGGLDGGAQRRRPVRPAGRLPVPEAEGRVRAAPGRGPHQPGPGDLAADHAVEPAGLRGDPGHAAGDPDRELAALHPPAVPARHRRPDPRAEARDRGLPEPHRHG